MRPLTRKQQRVLDGLRAHERPTARQLSDRLESPNFRSPTMSYDQAYSQLKALERRGLVERVPGVRAVHWAPTQAGLDAQTKPPPA